MLLNTKWTDLNYDDHDDDDDDNDNDQAWILKILHDCGMLKHMLSTFVTYSDCTLAYFINCFNVTYRNVSYSSWSRQTSSSITSLSSGSAPWQATFPCSRAFSNFFCPSSCPLSSTCTTYSVQWLHPCQIQTCNIVVNKGENYRSSVSHNNKNTYIQLHLSSHKENITEHEILKVFFFLSYPLY